MRKHCNSVFEMWLVCSNTNSTCYSVDPDYIPTVLTRAVELSRDYKKSKQKAKRRAEAAEKKRLRRVKETNRKICRFGYKARGMAAMTSGCKSGRKNGCGDVSYERESFLELPHTLADRTHSVSSMVGSSMVNYI